MGQIMTQDVDVSFVFVCDGCETRILVDDDVRASLLNAGGCIMCGEPISPADFERQE